MRTTYTAVVGQVSLSFLHGPKPLRYLLQMLLSCLWVAADHSLPCSKPPRCKTWPRCLSVSESIALVEVSVMLALSSSGWCRDDVSEHIPASFQRRWW